MMRDIDLHGLRLGTYVRISADTQENGSRNQRAEIDRFLVKHGLTVIDWYCDDVGKNPRGTRNPEFQRMMKDAELGRIDGIIVAYTQRLGFIGPDIVTDLLARIKALDVACWDIWERRDLRECWTDCDLWRKVVDATVHSHKDLEDMSRKQMRKNLDLGEQGFKAGGDAPYGMDSCYYDDDGTPLYRVVNYGRKRRVQIMPDGTKREYIGRPVPKDGHAKVIIQPSVEAERIENIRVMYEWCDREGLTPYQIAKRLNAMGRTTSEGKGWYDTAVRDYLTNPSYIGRPARCRRTFAKYSAIDENGDIVPINNPKPKRRLSSISPVMPAKAICPPIVDLGQWERVQKRMTPKRKAYASRNPDAWARGLLYCDRCGSAMSFTHDRRTGYKSWRCNNAGSGRTGCGGVVNDTLLRAVVGKWLEHTKHVLQSGEESKSLEVYIGQLKARFEAMDFGETDPAKIATIETEIERLRGEREQIAERALAMPVLAETEAFTQALNEKKRAIADLEYLRQELHERPTREQLVTNIEEAEKALGDGKSREYNEHLKTVIARIGCLNRPMGEGTDRRYNRRYELLGITVTPVNPISSDTFVAISEDTWLDMPQGATFYYAEDRARYERAIENNVQEGNEYLGICGQKS